MKVVFAAIGMVSAFQARDGVKSMLRTALTQDVPDVQESTNDACQIAGHYAEEGTAFYIRNSDVLEKLQVCEGDKACEEQFQGVYIGIKVPEARAKLVNNIVSESFPDFTGEFLTKCENVVPVGYSQMTQPCPVEEGGPIVQMTGVETITSCKDAFMNKADNTIAWFAEGQCFIGNSGATKEWAAENCHMDEYETGMGSLPEWSLMNDKVFNPVE